MVTSKNSHELKILRKCYTEWEKPKQPQSNQWFIPLAGRNEFSLNFINCLGGGNTKNIQSIDDNLLRNITEALVEHEANLQAREKVQMTKEFSLLRDVNIWWYRELAPDGFPRWGMRNPREIKSGWTEFIQKEVFPTRSIWNIVASIANILDIHAEYLDRQYNCTYSNFWNGELPQFDYIPNTLHLMRISSDPITAKLIETKLLHDKSRKIIGGIAQYSFNNQTFCLAATNNNGILRIGKDQLSTCFLNQHLFDEKPRWKIIFCQDIRAALILQNIFEKYNSDTMYNFLVTGHLGTNLESFPWDFFYGHDIIFIPAASKFSLSQIGYYKKLFLDADVNEFKIFPSFLLHSRPDSELAIAKENLPTLEAALLRDTIVLEDMSTPLRDAQVISEKSISYDEYMAWGQDIELFKKPKEVVTMSPDRVSSALPPPHDSLIPEISYDLSKVSLNHILQPESNVFIYGTKGTGKTHLALSACRSILKNEPLWALFPNNSVESSNVAYVDGETPYNEYIKNLMQHEIYNDERFFGLNWIAPDIPTFCENFNLTDANFCEGLYEYLLQNKCRYVFLDNITALMNGSENNDYAAHRVEKWINKLRKSKICPILIHHKQSNIRNNGNETSRGSQTFFNLSRVAIELISMDEVHANNALLENAKYKLDTSGLTVGVCFKACKPAPIIEKNTFWVHLGLGKAHCEYLAATGADGHAIELPTAKESLPPKEDSKLSPAQGFLNDKLNRLPPDLRDVVKVLEAGSNNRAGIQKQLEWSKDKVWAVLKKLMNMNVVRQEGQGKATYYVLNTNE